MASNEALQRAISIAMDNIREAWSALAMIREAVETLGPVGCIPSEEHICGQDGPGFMNEADALVAGIMKIATGCKKSPTSVDKESVCA